MGKKKAIKLATATAIAASAFVAVAPTQSEAATSSVDKAITKASSAMLKAFNTYNKTARVDGKLPTLANIKKDVKAGQDAYAAAAKEIASKGGTKAQKAALTKKLDTNKKYLDRAELYLKAVTTNLNPTKTAFTEAVAGGKQSKVLSAQTAYQAKIKEFKDNVAKVYGPDARDLLLEKYAEPAQKLADSVNDEMKVYAAYKAIEKGDLIEKDLEAAFKEIDGAKEEAAKIAKLDTTLAKNITKAVEKNNKKFEDTVQAAVTIEGITDGEKTDEETKTITVKATKGSEIKVTLNGTAVAANENGSYTLKLQEGSNKVAVESTVYGVKTELNKEITSNQTPAVKSVSAINLKQVEVKFNKELDKASAETTTNYDLKVGAASVVNPTDAKVIGEDTVLLTFNAQSQSTDASLKVKNVKTAKGIVADTTKDIRFIDVVAPKAETVEVVAPRVIRVNFSEPLQSAPTFKLNNGATAIVSTSWTPGQDYADLTIGIDPENGSSHTLTVSGGNDYAGFKIDEASKSFVYQTNVTAPTATVSKVVDNHTVEIQFDKEINASTLTSNLEIFHTVKGGNGYKADAVTSLKNGTNDTIVVNFAGAVFPEGQVKFFLGYGDEKGTLVQDKWGNKLTVQELTASYAADTTAPVLSSVEGKTKRTIEVKFNEEIKRNTATAANIVLVDADNKAVPADVELGSDGKTVTIKSTSDLAGGNYKLTVKNVTDTSNNKIAEVSRTFYVNDMVAPSVNETADLLAGNKKVKVKFSEAMNAASITDKSKYQYNNAELNSAVTVTAVDGNKAVILDFSGVTDFTSAAGKVVVVGRVADATGNLTEAFSTNVEISGTQSTIAATKAEVTGEHTVKLYFDEVITNAVAADFVVSKEDAVLTTTNVVNSIESGKSVLTLTVSENLPATAADVTVDSSTAENYTVKAKNNDGLLVKFADLAAADKFAPEIKTATFEDGTNPEDKDKLVLTFSEALYAQSVQDADFTVVGRTIESLEVNGATITVNLKADNSDSSSIPASVSLVGSVEDTARNVKTSQVFVTITPAGE
ncbi:Ig-like domain-containing protein [Peribacillus sp. NPDC097284]|uniref:Ig-like domain-containing protein n=1 Tax=Peribacillus sp. NPDC097284 TaxID=3364401 RepID=UPI00382027F9